MAVSWDPHTEDEKEKKPFLIKLSVWVIIQKDANYKQTFINPHQHYAWVMDSRASWG